MPRRVVNTPFGWIGVAEPSDGFSRAQVGIQTLPVVPDLNDVRLVGTLGNVTR